MSRVTWVSAGVFHIDADEVAGGVGMLSEIGGDLLGQGRVLGEAHLGELDADIGVELARGNLRR